MSNIRTLKFIVEVVVRGEIQSDTETLEREVGKNLAQGIQRQYGEVGITPENEEDAYVIDITVENEHGEVIASAGP